MHGWVGAKPRPAPGPQLPGSEHIPLLAWMSPEPILALHSSGLVVWSRPRASGLKTAWLMEEGAWNQTCWRQTAISVVRGGIGGRSGVRDGMSMARVGVGATPGAGALNSVPSSWASPSTNEERCLLTLCSKCFDIVCLGREVNPQLCPRVLVLFPS